MRIILSLLMLTSLTGCSAWLKKAVEKPKIDIARVGLSEMSGSGAIVVFGVKVENPNSFPLKVDGFTYDVEIGKEHLTNGEVTHPSEVPARGSAVVDIPVAVKFENLFASIGEILKHKATPYKINGKARVGFLSIPFEHKGEVKLDKKSD